MEQMSSDEHLGSLAEAVLEALRGLPEAAEKVTLLLTIMIQKTTSFCPPGEPGEDCYPRREEKVGDGNESQTVKSHRSQDKRQGPGEGGHVAVAAVSGCGRGDGTSLCHLSRGVMKMMLVLITTVLMLMMY